MAAKVLLFSILTRRSEIVPQSNMLAIDFEVVQNSIELVGFKQQALKKYPANAIALMIYVLQ